MTYRGWLFFFGFFGWLAVLLIDVLQVGIVVAPRLPNLFLVGSLWVFLPGFLYFFE